MPDTPRLEPSGRLDADGESQGPSESASLSEVPAAMPAACMCCPSSRIFHEDEHMTEERCSL